MQCVPRAPGSAVEAVQRALRSVRTSGCVLCFVWPQLEGVACPSLACEASMHGTSTRASPSTSFSSLDRSTPRCAVPSRISLCRPRRQMSHERGSAATQRTQQRPARHKREGDGAQALHSFPDLRCGASRSCCQASPRPGTLGAYHTLLAYRTLVLAGPAPGTTVLVPCAC